MSTKITINVSGNQLAQNNKEKQLANRQAFIEAQQLKELEEQAKEEKQQQEILRDPLRAGDGAVPEYGIEEETSAQRGGGIGMGWVYDSYEDIFEQEYVAQNFVDGVVSNKYRVAVGSGNGTSWEYAEATVPVPANAREVSTIINPGPVYTISVTLGDPFPAVFGGNVYVECQGVHPTIPVERAYASSDVYKQDPPMVGSFILPISADQCVLVGSIVVRWRVVREYIGGNSVILLPEGYNFGTSSILGPVGPKTYFTDAGVPITIEDARCEWPRPSLFDDLFPPEPENELVSSGAERTDFAFLISTKKVVSLQVRDLLKQRLDAIFPTPEISGTEWSISFWPDTSYAALGASFNVRTDTWGPVIAGAPSIFDILDSNNNFDLYKNTSEANKGVSAYASVVPRFSPDCILDLDDPLSKEVPNIYSAFYFGRKLTTRPFVPPAPPNINGANVNLSEYIYLTPAQRADSDYYLYSATEAKELLDERLVANPALAFMSIRNPPDGVYQNDGFLQLIWNPTSGFTRNKQGVALSPTRILPPALFSSDLTPHPLIKKQPTSYPNPLVYFSSPYYSRFTLRTLFWTAWGRNWRGKLLQLGVSFAPAE